MKKYIKYIFPIFALILLTSCLKDKELIGPDSEDFVSINIVEFPPMAAPLSNKTSKVPLYAFAYDIVPNATFNVAVKSVGLEPAKEDIKVTIALNNDLLNVYNEQFETEYTPLPTSQYTISSFEATIKKGEREAIIPISLKPDLFTFDKDFAIGLSIVSLSSGEISGNFNNVIFNLGAKNQLDGVFKYTTSAATSLVPNANKTVELKTVGQYRVQLDPGLLGTYSNEVYYNIDPITNQITVECPSLGVQLPQDIRSKWDPSTKIMTVYWKQLGGGRTFEETFTYTGVR